MASTTEPRSGLYTFDDFADGDPGWGVELIANVLRIGRFGFHLSVKDRGLTAPPGSPAAGDSYIVATSATGDWETHDGKIAVWDGTAWVFAQPRNGWLAWIEDESVLSAYQGSAWTAGAALGS